MRRHLPAWFGCHRPGRRRARARKSLRAQGDMLVPSIRSGELVITVQAPVVAVASLPARSALAPQTWLDDCSVHEMDCSVRKEEFRVLTGSSFSFSYPSFAFFVPQRVDICSSVCSRARGPIRYSTLRPIPLKLRRQSLSRYGSPAINCVLIRVVRDVAGRLSSYLSAVGEVSYHSWALFHAPLELEKAGTLPV